LRERVEDLKLLVNHFVKRFSRELGKDVHEVDDQAMELLRQHTWPGNLRELQSVLKQALLQASGPVLIAEFLPVYLRKDSHQIEQDSSSTTLDLIRFIQDRLEANSNDLYAETIVLLERMLLTEVLRYTSGNQVQAAKILGITRNSLRHKIRSLDITIE